MVQKILFEQGYAIIHGRSNYSFYMVPPNIAHKNLYQSLILRLAQGLPEPAIKKILTLLHFYFQRNYRVTARCVDSIQRFKLQVNIGQSF